jgi:Ca2+:H+ antiporter
MLIPSKKLAPPPTFFMSIKAILVASWLNLLLLCIPVSWALHWALPDSNKNKDTLVFIFSFFAIIPLAKLLAFATDELSMRVGQTLAGLLNATLGNAVELIVAIIALVKCELRIVQASLVGSVLSNLLLVLGMCFFAGGLKFSEQGFGISATQLNSSLLTISVIAVLLPAAFHFAADPELDNPTEAADILSVSHGVAIVLLSSKSQVSTTI